MAGQTNNSSGVRLQGGTQPPTQQIGRTSVTGPMYVNGSAILNNVVLADTFATNDPFRLVTGAAVHVQSDDVAEPLIDGIILESGNSGDSRPSVMIKGCKVPTPLAITQDIHFWLGIDGKITSTIPTLAHGDVWLVPVCHSDELGYLIFDDPMPIKL